MVREIPVIFGPKDGSEADLLKGALFYLYIKPDLSFLKQKLVVFVSCAKLRV